MAVVEVSLASEMQNYYLEYSLANIARAIPSAFDGLLTVQRRILFTALHEGFFSHKPYVKAAKLEGNVMGLVHPHSGSFGSIVQMANTWNNLQNLLDGWGNYGDATSNAASSRYVEIKLSYYSEQCLLQESETWATKPNYDGSLQEPTCLSAKLPNLLIFGNTGISVGFASNCLSHNINEVIDETAKYISRDGNGLVKLFPDFKQGCDIFASNETLQQYAEIGRASFRLRAKLVSVETTKEKRTELTKYTFENIPYGTNTEKIGEQIKKSVESGKYGDLQIKAIDDESDRTGSRLSVVSKRNDIAELLYGICDLETTVSANNTVLNEKGIPVQVGASELIRMWFENRKEQIKRWATFRSNKLKASLHIVEGYLKMLKAKNKAIKAIQDADSYEMAKASLIKLFDLSDKQAESILELKLKQITKLNLEKFESEENELKVEIATLTGNIEDPTSLILTQLKDIKKQFGQKRLCKTAVVKESQVVKEVKTIEIVKPLQRISFFSLNLAKGIVEAGAIKSNSSFTANTEDKIIAIAENGLVYRLGAGNKGPISDKPLKILWQEKESKCLENDEALIGLTAIDEKGRAVGKAIKVSDLTKSLSKGTYLGFKEGMKDLKVTKANGLKLLNKGQKFAKL